jgi:hypothetical protein
VSAASVRRTYERIHGHTSGTRSRLQIDLADQTIDDDEQTRGIASTCGQRSILNTADESLGRFNNSLGVLRVQKAPGALLAVTWNCARDV